MAMLERGRRSTCGTRMTELIGEAAEMDKAFWDSAVWAEGDDSENDSFNEDDEEVKPDTFDSDFNDTETDESDEDEDGQLKAQQRRERTAAARTAGGYKEPIKPLTKNKPPREAKSKVKEKSKDIFSPGGVTLRHSTQSKSTARAKELLVIKAKTPIKVHRPPIPKKEYSQRDLLLEALETEVVNFKWLRSQQMAEEERNRMESKSTKPTKKIARTLLSSQKGGGGSTITFVDDAAWPSELFDSQLDTRRRSEKREGGYGDDDDSIKSGGGERKQASLVCAVTGLPARYRDPLTLLPYHDVGAFRTIRENHKHQLVKHQSQQKVKSFQRQPQQITSTIVCASASIGGGIGNASTHDLPACTISESKGTVRKFSRAKIKAGAATVTEDPKVPKKRGRKPKASNAAVNQLEEINSVGEDDEDSIALGLAYFASS